MILMGRNGAFYLENYEKNLRGHILKKTKKYDQNGKFRMKYFLNLQNHYFCRIKKGPVGL